MSKFVTKDSLTNILKTVKTNEAKAITDAKIKNVSELTNDSKFQKDTEVTSTVSTLLENVKQYTKSAVDSLIGFNIVVADALPEEDIKINTLYLIKNGESTETNQYDEYLYIDSNWEKVGSVKTDLSDLYNKSEMDTKISDLTTNNSALSSDEVQEVISEVWAADQA